MTPRTSFRLPFFPVLLLVALGLLGFAEPTPDQLVGEWRQDDGRSSITATFDASGRYSEVMKQGAVVSRRSGQWSRQGNTISYTAMKNDQNGGKIADYKDTIEELTDDTLKLRFGPKTVYTFKRTK
ncbi:MAG TPA: hypothetical protein VGD88_12810 [Opitutaceae bacterium]